MSVIRTSKQIFLEYKRMSIMCGYFCIGFIDFMLAGKTLTDFTNLFSWNNFKKDDDMILKHFMTNVWKIGVNKVINNSLKP